MARASLRSTSPPFQQKGAPFILFFHSQPALVPRLIVKPFPLCAVVRRMKDDPDTMRARLDKLAELVELARQVPWEDHGHVERALHLISQALQKVAQVRSQNQDEAHLGEEAEFVALCRQIEEMCRLAGLRIMLDRPSE